MIAVSRSEGVVRSVHSLLAEGDRCAPSHLSGTRKVLDVIFSYTNRNTDFTEKFFVRVDVTDEFPFLVTKIWPYYNRVKPHNL
jgi:PatG C-terminal